MLSQQFLVSSKVDANCR